MIRLLLIIIMIRLLLIPIYLFAINYLQNFSSIILMELLCFGILSILLDFVFPKMNLIIYFEKEENYLESFKKLKMEHYLNVLINLSIYFGITVIEPYTINLSMERFTRCIIYSLVLYL